MQIRSAGRKDLRSPLEIWGGVECTVNRVGNRYFDQLERTGHSARVSDLEMFASLGLRTLRYPVLWERVAPNGPDSADWHWVDERMRCMQSLGIRPIIGFLHHGSGPPHTRLTASQFAEDLARFAGEFARRYPHVDMYTPVNEPLTTARFSGLYGHWFPHGRNDLTFVTALFAQIRATVLAMRAVRATVPNAALVQTEDIGRVYSTPRLAYQASFENERRWLTFDLLTGRPLDKSLRSYLKRIPGGEENLQWFADNPSPPDILGVNYYATSERFLDDRINIYPPHLRGGNARHRYADVEAVRILASGTAGIAGVLRETWDRYRLPLAVTEVHLGGWREDQLRWLIEAWEGANALRDGGADVRAITSWALLGAYDWPSLLTRPDGYYESGAFDVRGGAPRPTAIAHAIRELVNGKTPSHPILAGPGWWRRHDRLQYPSHAGVLAHSPGVTRRRAVRRKRPVLITGATGTLGRAFARICSVRGIEHRVVARQEMDIADRHSVISAIETFDPWAIINAAGYVRVDDAETAVDLCRRENVEGPSVLALACAERGLSLVTFSSDLVFNGNQSAPYVESDSVEPLNAYGRSKAEAERRVLEIMPDTLVVRTSAFFGPWDMHNVVTRALDTLAAGDPFTVASDAIVSPTFVPDLVHVTLDLLIDRESGVWHLANNGATSWSDLVLHAAKLADVNVRRLQLRPLEELGLAALRPKYSVLGSNRALLLPELDDALGRYARERTPVPAARVLRTAQIQ
jgi:dTDP-4-dehydrorhamnose reductase